MFALLCVAAGAGVGCGVCAFGMWAFLRGESAALTVSRGGLPSVGLPSVGLPSVGRPSEKGGGADGGTLSREIAALFSEGGE